MNRKGRRHTSAFTPGRRVNPAKNPIIAAPTKKAGRQAGRQAGR